MPWLQNRCQLIIKFTVSGQRPLIPPDSLQVRQSHERDRSEPRVSALCFRRLLRSQRRLPTDLYK